MKPKNNNLHFWLHALAFSAFISSSLTVRAIEYTWDSAATSGIQLGIQNWSTTGTNWTTDGGTTRVGWPNTGTDSAFLSGTLAADVTISLNSSDIKLDDLSASVGAGRFCYLNQVSSTTQVRTLTLTGGSYTGTGTTGSQFNVTTGNISIAGAAGTTAFKWTGNSDVVKLGSASLFIASAGHDFTGNIHLLEGGLFVTSGNNSSLGNVENDIFINGGNLSAQTTALTLGSGRTISLGASGGKFGGNATLTVQGQITGAGSLEKVGTGALVLEGGADYAGTTTITAGILRPQASGNIPSASNLIINGAGNFNIRSTNNWIHTGTITGDGTGSVNLNTGTNATLAGNISGVLSVNGNSVGTNATVSGIISGAASVNAQNAGGTLRLSGNNTYTGITTVANTATLIVNGNHSAATGTVTVSAGGTLAGSGTIASATTIDGIHAPGGDVTGVQTFTAGISYAAASTLAVNLGTNSSSSGLRGTFPLGYGGADVTAGAVNLDATATGRVALNSAAGDLNLSNSFWNSPQQWLVLDVKGSATAVDSNAPVSAGATLNGSAFNTAAYGSFSFSRAAGSTSENSVWLEWTPSTVPTWTGASGDSWATAGNWTPAAPGTGDIVRFHTSSTSNLTTVLGADRDLPGLAVINPSGPVSIGGGNTLTVGTGGIDLAFSTQNLTITAPVVMSAAQTWTVASGRTLSVNGGLSGAFPVSMSGAGTVSLGGAVDPLVAMTVASGSTLKMGASGVLSNAATAVNLVLNGKLDLNGTSQSVNLLSGSGIIDNTAAGAATLTLGNNDAAGTLSTVFQNTTGTLALVKTGAGNLTLPVANTYSGGFTNNGTGNVTPNHSSSFGTGPVISNAGQIYSTATVVFANSLVLNNSILRIGGGGSRTLTWNGPVTATGTSGLSSDGGTAGLTLGSTLNIAGATFTSFANGNTNTIAGSITGAGGNLTVTSGTLALDGANSYTGTTTLNQSAGTSVALILRSTGTISSSSNVTINASGNFVVRNTGSWIYTGTISGDGTGQVNLNTGTNATLAGDISGVLNVNANSAGTDATISGDISGATNVTVQGTVDVNGLGAILRLAGSNSYTGNTTVTRGSLILAAGNTLPDTTPVSIGNATLDAATFTDTTGTLDVTSTATINLGTGAVLTFANSSAVSWTGGSLNITGTFVPGVSLRFGTTSGGLTVDQLALITVNGNTGPFGLNSSGFLTNASAGSGYDTWKAQITNGLDLRGDDADGDGFTNLEEFLFGSSPITGNGSLVTPTAGGGNLVLRWLQRETGATYTLKQSSTLATGSWSTVISPVPTMDGDQTGATTDYDYYTVTLPTSGGESFYRIEGLEN